MDIAIGPRPPRNAEADPRSKFRAGKPPIGGWLPGLAFTPTQTVVLNTIVDHLIPGGDGFPAPSEVNVVAFFGKYLPPDGQEPRWFPFIGEVEFKGRLDALGEDFNGADPTDQIETLQLMEQRDPVFFHRLRDLTYYAYYSRPPVIAAINKNLEAGKDLRNSPQPYGYSDTMDDWNDQLFNNVQGSYTRTEDVRPVELPDALRGTRNNHKVEGGLSV
ncbi:gluconate 2-dehydrogenase subunit 3 family protein [Arthrobacter sp. Soil762]|uniref:gluconate 2-dehydrogenase subunit 3 family protein n=1 Tax=Arthrobacter sp. Soil762 TaxID=1736401 RepID=UPI0006F76ED6|nr:gluconate 2-dehydrogenase subunit 3 family protein [Arthrobacter sp. Soil762]KRE76011.1 hypothetical protein ASG77_20530 [Arthrobacter sp. Soil762]